VLPTIGRRVSAMHCWLGKGMNLIADFLEPWLVQPHSTVIIPLYKCVVFVRFLDCSEFSSRLSEIAQSLNTISGVKFLACGGLNQAWLLGTV
jgi:hypothetical protein